MIILEISDDNAFGSSYGYVILSDGSSPNWYNYKNKYAFFKQYPMVATYIKNDTEEDDSITYFKIS